MSTPAEPSEISTLLQHYEGVRSIAFSDDGTRLASASDDRSIALWDVSDLHSLFLLSILTGHGNHVEALDFSPNGKILASGADGEPGTVFLWDMVPKSWANTLCQAVGRNLTLSEWAQYFPGEEYRITCPQWPAEQ